ncbi:MAG: hypothetical protein HY791_39585 [Deltaproteobacteria bacterium]|nr:hypothetical protein [Deltaproteobacteria bacterium]
MKTDPRIASLAVARASAAQAVDDCRATCERLERPLAVARGELADAKRRLQSLDRQIDAVSPAEADIAASSLGLSDGSPAERIASIRFEEGRTIGRRVDGRKVDLGPAPVRFIDLDVAPEVSAAMEGRRAMIRSIGDIQRRVEEGRVARADLQRQAHEAGQALGLDVAIAPTTLPRSVLELARNEDKLARDAKMLEAQLESIRRAPFSLGDREIARTLGVAIADLGPLDRCVSVSRGIHSRVLRSVGGRIFEIPQEQPISDHSPTSPRDLDRSGSLFAN